MIIQGYWYDAKQSTQQAVELRWDGEQLQVLSQPEAQVLFTGEPSQLSFSSRLGNSARYIYFPDGQKLETRDNDGVDQLAKSQCGGGFNGLLYQLETRTIYVLASVLTMVLIIAWFGLYGVPQASKAIAFAMPESLEQEASQQTLKAMDSQWFTPSELDESVKARVRAHFAGIIEEHPEHAIQLHFRASEIGANAFALPGGVIIFTDDMVNLAEHDDELLSVMAHEVGHVVARHGMRNAIQGSLLGFSLMLLSGDSSAASELFLGIPVLLTQLGYSRQFEEEADDYALAYMQDKGLDPLHFVRLMSRVEKSARGCLDQSEQNSDEQKPECADYEHGHDHSHWSHSHAAQYLSTHPAMSERLEKFNKSSSHDH